MMTAETSKIKTKLVNLNASLGELESLLEPLLSQSLPETLIGLEPIQQAKLQTVLPYVVYDLVFIYLKAKGVDPKTHPVVSELDRVRQYFEKLAIAENPPIKRTEVDKDAAERFIKHAISQAVVKSNPVPSSSSLSSTTTSTSIPVKMTTKMIARAQYQYTLEKERRERGEEEEEGLRMYDEADPIDSSVDDDHTVGSREFTTSTSPPSKRRRQAIDSFAGYGEETNTPDQDTLSKRQKINPTSTTDVAPSKDRKTKKKKSKKSY